MVGTKLRNWILGEKLGEGGCATVYAVTNADPKVGSLVIKCAKLPTGNGRSAKEQCRLANTLYYEHMLYKGVLLDANFVPSLPSQSYGEDKGYRFLVMQRLDYDLRHLASCGSTPSLSTVCNIGLAILDGLRFIHEKGYVYVDLKPDNFMICKHSNSLHNEFKDQDKLYFVDYGLMEKFTDYVSGGIRPQVMQAFCGTATYASVSLQEGYPASRGNDIEALVRDTYMCIVVTISYVYVLIGLCTTIDVDKTKVALVKC
jgi:serine/threonine protein kinase